MPPSIQGAVTDGVQVEKEGRASGGAALGRTRWPEGLDQRDVENLRLVQPDTVADGLQVQKEGRASGGAAPGRTRWLEGLDQRDIENLRLVQPDAWKLLVR